MSSPNTVQPMTDHGERTRGVDFGDFAAALADCEYPVTSAELVARHGDRELEYAGGRERVAAVLGPTRGTFHSAREVRAFVLGSVGMGAVGRPRYTDRDGVVPGTRSRAHATTL